MDSYIMSHDAHSTSSVSLIQKLIVVLGGIVAPIFVVYNLTKSPGVQVEKAAATINVAENIKPLAVVEVAAESGTHVEKSGEEVVNQACMACHGSGLMSSPTIGDNAAWAPRIALGYEALTKNAIEGVRTMPARGGNPDLSDIEIAKAVAFMANKSGASFTPPAD
jgi:cytochrome c5